MPVRFKHAGKEYTGQRTPIIDRQDMVDAGYEQTFDFLLIVRVSEFDGKPMPAVHAEIEICDELQDKWIPCRIELSTPDQAGVTVQYGVVESV